ncbi:MAG: hypothetical protein E7324_00915 [Clostridiales bacterium]|nr:hypothetical protein [Clostridiales bacterium]
MSKLIDGGVYKIVAPDGLVLAGDDFGYHEGDRVVLQPYTYDLNQAWKLKKTASGSWNIINMAAGMTMCSMGLVYHQMDHAPFFLFTKPCGCVFSIIEEDDGCYIALNDDHKMTAEQGAHQPVLIGKGTPLRFELLDDGSYELPQVKVLCGDTIHMGIPELIKDGEWYYAVYDNLTRGDTKGRIGLNRSRDMIRWHLYDEFMPQSTPRPFPWMDEMVPGCEIWCPGIAHFGGKYRIYYAATRNLKNTTVMAMITNDTLDVNDPRYAWKDAGPVMRTTETDNYNVIDPHIFRTYDDELWMVFGSAWSGVKLCRINEETGMLYDGEMVSVAYREEFPHSCEGGYLFKRNGWYYLMVVVERGDQNYRAIVGRSRDIRGPYVDKNGVSLMDEGGETIVEYKQRGVYYPGHCSVFQEGEQYYMVFENWYDRCSTTQMNISTIIWEDDWPDTAVGRRVLKRFEKP